MSLCGTNKIFTSSVSSDNFALKYHNCRRPRSYQPEHQHLPSSYEYVRQINTKVFQDAELITGVEPGINWSVSLTLPGQTMEGRAGLGKEDAVSEAAAAVVGRSALRQDCSGSANANEINHFLNLTNHYVMKMDIKRK